jgi:hypothetical protein
MRYEITRLVLGCRTRLPIDESAFAEIRDARDALSLLFQIELDYDILIGNWLQLEKAAMCLSLDSFARSRLERTEFDRDHTELNRNIVNLLSSARGFIDHTEHHLASLPGSTPADKKSVHKLFSAQYDACLSYRVSEELRDYTQHCGLPTQGFTYHNRRMEEMEDWKLVRSVSPYLLLDVLHRDPKFDKKVLEELESLKGKNVPVMPLLREYVASLSAIIGEVRHQYQEKINAWSNTLDEWVHRYSESASGSETSMLGVAARRTDENGRIMEEIHLTVQFRERIAALQETNQRLVNLHKLQVIG